MFQRQLTTTLKQAVTSFPVTVLTGPRQSGKTTLLRYLFPDYTYQNLEFPDTLLAATEDPRHFLKSNPNGLIIDEAQNHPALFSYIQGHVDQVKQPGQFILSGSQNFLLAEKISQTLAGRSALLELLPLSYQEYLSNSEKTTLNLWEFLFYGGYPRPYHENLDTKLWYNAYIRTYLERDVRSLINVKDLTKFQLFLKLCAGRHGQLLNTNGLANDCGISHTTVAHWLSILEASYILYRLPPHYKKFNKRLVKSSKIYFYDSAIVCQLLGIESPEHLKSHAHRGHIFEGFILTEIIKYYYSKGEIPPLYFWRNHTGLEIDGILEIADKLIALEIKSAITIAPDFFENLMQWKKIAKTEATQSFLIYGGEEKMSRKGIDIIPWFGVYEMLENSTIL